MAWITFEHEGYLIVVPELDIHPHGKWDGNTESVELCVGLECPCKPRVSFGTGEGVFEKPMILHNSFEEKEILDKAMVSYGI